jgi:hypothetical protein
VQCDVVWCNKQLCTSWCAVRGVCACMLHAACCMVRAREPVCGQPNLDIVSAVQFFQHLALLTLLLLLLLALVFLLFVVFLAWLARKAAFRTKKRVPTLAAFAFSSSFVLFPVSIRVCVPSMHSCMHACTPSCINTSFCQSFLNLSGQRGSRKKKKTVHQRAHACRRPTTDLPLRHELDHVGILLGYRPAR